MALLISTYCLVAAWRLTVGAPDSVSAPVIVSPALATFVASAAALSVTSAHARAISRYWSSLNFLSPSVSRFAGACCGTNGISTVLLPQCSSNTRLTAKSPTLWQRTQYSPPCRSPANFRDERIDPQIRRRVKGSVVLPRQRPLDHLAKPHPQADRRAFELRPHAIDHLHLLKVVDEFAATLLSDNPQILPREHRRKRHTVARNSRVQLVEFVIRIRQRPTRVRCTKNDFLPDNL